MASLVAHDQVTWRCFHCGDVFDCEDDATNHFGTHWDETPLCKVVDDPVAALRLMNSRGWVTPRIHGAVVDRVIDQEEKIDWLKGGEAAARRTYMQFDGAKTLHDAYDRYDCLKFSHDELINVHRLIRPAVRFFNYLTGWNS